MLDRREKLGQQQTAAKDGTRLCVLMPPVFRNYITVPFILFPLGQCQEEIAQNTQFVIYPSIFPAFVLHRRDNIGVQSGTGGSRSAVRAKET
jgi:hypothetical protein